MDNDKIDRTIDIILQNQAQFYANLQELQEVQKESEKRISELEKTMHSLVRVTLKTSETVDKLAEKVDKLTEKVDTLADAQKDTDERLNAVIFMAEKYFSRNNGDSDKK